MSQFATRFKHRQHTENITDDDECPIHLFNYPWYNIETGLIVLEQAVQQLVANSMERGSCGRESEKFVGI